MLVAVLTRLTKYSDCVKRDTQKNAVRPQATSLGYFNKLGEALSIYGGRHRTAGRAQPEKTDMIWQET